jgi:hypothetical protein
MSSPKSPKAKGHWGYLALLEAQKKGIELAGDIYGISQQFPSTPYWSELHKKALEVVTGLNVRLKALETDMFNKLGS